MGSSFSWRIERVLLNIPGFPSNPGGARANRAHLVAGFGGKALLVLLYLTGRLLRRPSCAGSSKLVSGPVSSLVCGKEKRAGHTSREPGIFADRDGDSSPSQSLFWALNSAVECHLHTVEVAGSNPAAPTKINNLRGVSPHLGPIWVQGPIWSHLCGPLAVPPLSYERSERLAEWLAHTCQR